MSKQLPERPNLEQLRKQAKELLGAFRNGEAEALERFRLLPERPTVAGLHHAQSLVAREYGFDSWTKLVRHVEAVGASEGITQEVVERFVRYATSENQGGLRRLLDLYPGLPRQGLVPALLCGEVSVVAESLDGIETFWAPNGWRALPYVCSSRVWQVAPERDEAVLDCARYLLDAGADPNERYTEYEVPVLYGATCESRHIGLAKLLLDRGAKPNDGESVYHSAQLNFEPMLELLLEHGADLSGSDPNWGNTPLYFNAGHRASDAGYDRALLGCQWLLKHGADPNIPSGECGQTPLFAAIRGGSTRLAQLLVDHGANPNHTDTDGLTPYMLAAATGAGDILGLLEKAGAETSLPPSTEFLAACARGDMKRVLSALASDPELIPNLDQRGRNAFCKMAELGRTVGVQTCLEAGFPPETVGGNENGTPLHYASYCGWDETASVLIKAGSPLDLKDLTYKATPLGWALEGLLWNRNSQGDYVRIVRELLGAGASDENLRERLETDDAENPAMLELMEALPKP